MCFLNEILGLSTSISVSAEYAKTRGQDRNTKLRRKPKGWHNCIRKYSLKNPSTQKHIIEKLNHKVLLR